MYFTLNSILLSLIFMVHPITLCVMTVKCHLIVDNGFYMIFDLCYGCSSSAFGEISFCHLSLIHPTPLYVCQKSTRQNMNTVFSVLKDSFFMILLSLRKWNLSHDSYGYKMAKTNHIKGYGQVLQLKFM